MSTPAGFVTGSQLTVRLFALTSSFFDGLVITGPAGITCVRRSEPTILRPSTERPRDLGELGLCRLPEELGEPPAAQPPLGLRLHHQLAPLRVAERELVPLVDVGEQLKTDVSVRRVRLDEQSVDLVRDRLLLRPLARVAAARRGNCDGRGRRRERRQERDDSNSASHVQPPVWLPKTDPVLWLGEMKTR